MKNTILNTVLLIFGTQLAAQNFPGTAPLPIPPGAPGSTVGITQSSCSVGGVGVLGGCSIIESVSINLTHTFVGDIGILLVAPNGAFLDLSTSNGGGGDNYTNTVFSDAAPTFITSSAPPYTGTFRPEGRATTLNNPYSNANPLGTFTFANTFNGVNADGNWTLYINDYVAADIGNLLSWSITFSNGGTPPTANAGPDVTICPGQNVTLTATGGGTYEWSTSSTSASTTVSPSMTTTYTVTVTAPGCGTDTDDVTVNVQPLSVGITSPSTGICPSGTAVLTASPGFTNYSWSSSQSGQSITVSSAGTYIVTATNSSGCTAMASYDLVPRPEPTVSFSTSANDLCPGECQTITVDLVGTAPFSFQWRLQPGGALQTVNTSSSTTSFQVCAPATPGLVQIVICSLTDAFCTNQ